jgi:hypothetical protein
MEEFFIISIRNIDSSWSLGDLRDDYHAIEYCEQVLDIPEEYIMDASLGADGLEVSLCDLDEDSLYYDDDWYIQLKRVSNTTARAA